MAAVSGRESKSDKHVMVSSKRLLPLALGLCLGTTTVIMPTDAEGAAAGTTSNAAEPRPGETRQLEADAIKAYEDGRFEEAIRLFEAAYESTADPNLLFNIGRVYEQAGELERAIEYYERFVHAKGVSLDTRVIANERLVQLKKIVGGDASSDESGTEPVDGPVDGSVDGSVDSPDDSDTATSDETTATDPEADTDDDADSAPRGLLVGGAILLGIGAPLAIAGGVIGGAAIANDRRLAANRLNDPVGTQKQGRRLALVADVTVPVGATVAAVGVSMLIINAVRQSRGRASEEATLGAAVGHQYTGLVFTRRF